MFENLQKVAFNIASEASYVYNLSGQKLIKNAKNGWKTYFIEMSVLTNVTFIEVTSNSK